MPTRFVIRWTCRTRSPGDMRLVLPRAVPTLVTLAALTTLPASAAEDTTTLGSGGQGGTVAMASLLGRVAAQAPAAREAGMAVMNDGTGTSSPAVPVADAQGHVHDELSRVTVSKWLGRGRASLGVGLGAVGYRPLPGQATAPAAGLMNPAPAVTVGVRVDVAPRTTMYADASGTAVWNTANDPNAQGALYNTRVGMEFKSAGAARGLGFDRGAIGMQLDSGYRLQMKPRRGGLAVYLRGQF